MTASGYEERAYLERSVDASGLREILKTDRSWVPYPAYADRGGWEKLMGDSREELIRRGEKMLDYPWQVIKATDYLEFERSGNREVMQRPHAANCNALKDLVLAELAEGKGRFMNQIANGVFYFSEMTAWSLSAHLTAQKNHRPLPDDQEQIIDLTSGEISSILSWTHYFLKDELDKIHPLLASRLKRELYKRTIEPYLTRSYHWSALNRPKGCFVNNWNPWCNTNVLQTMLLMSDDPAEMCEGVRRTMLSVDCFMNYVKGDGACEEGPSYWTHAAGKLYDYLTLISMATQGKVKLFDKPLVRRMGEYLADSYVGDGWVVNFADASAKGGGDPDLVYRYGKAVNSPVMTGYAASLMGKAGKKAGAPRGMDMFRTLEWFASHKELMAEEPSIVRNDVSWYPETEFCYLYDKGNGFFVATKGGNNGESHNHNDVGTFSLYVRNMPVIIDVGVGTYTRQTFSNERYSIWTMQSDYHNLPAINGVSQKDGGKFHATQTSCDAASKSFSINIASAYPPEAKVKDWTRTCTLGSDGLKVTDAYVLDEVLAAPVLHYMTWAEPDISTPGKVVLDKEGRKVTMTYDPSQLEASVEKVSLTDKALTRVWGDAVYRLVLKGRQADKDGSYTVKFR